MHDPEARKVRPPQLAASFYHAAFLARLGRAKPSDERRLSGVKRKWLGHRQTDASDPRLGKRHNEAGQLS